MKRNLVTPLKQFIAYASMILLTLVLFACSDDDDGGPNTSSIKITSMTPASPATLKYYGTSENDHVRIVYDYAVIEPNGVRIWIKPKSTTAINYKYVYSPSKICTGTGTNSVIVSVNSEDESLVVDKLILTIYDPQTEVRSEDSVAVNYTFSK